MFDEQKFLSELESVDTSANDITCAEITAIINVLHNNADRSVGLWKVVNYAFSCGFQKGKGCA